jgi:hypothetical protein
VVGEGVKVGSLCSDVGKEQRLADSSRLNPRRARGGYLRKDGPKTSLEIVAHSCYQEIGPAAAVRHAAFDELQDGFPSSAPRDGRIRKSVLLCSRCSLITRSPSSPNGSVPTQSIRTTSCPAYLCSRPGITCGAGVPPAWAAGTAAPQNPEVILGRPLCNTSPRSTNRLTTRRNTAKPEIIGACRHVQHPRRTTASKDRLTVARPMSGSTRRPT